jgi:hypothetical protein
MEAGNEACPIGETRFPKSGVTGAKAPSFFKAYAAVKRRFLTIADYVR